jgi:hypothetical protein
VAPLSQGRTAAAQCGLFTHTSVPVIFEPPCTYIARLFSYFFSFFLFSSTFFGQQSNSGLGRLIVDVSRSHKTTHTHTRALSVRRRSHYLRDTQQREEINISSLSGIPTRFSTSQADGDLRFLEKCLAVVDRSFKCLLQA